MLSVRSLLFAPATRPDLVAKLTRSGPDIAVIDLEDGVADSAKAEARPMARDGASALLAQPGGTQVFVRVNAVGSGLMNADIAEGLVPGLAGVVVPKLESAAQVRMIRQTLDVAGFRDLQIIGGVENVEGLAQAGDIAAAGLCALYFGADAYISDVGGRRTAEGLEVLFARSTVVLVARRAGIPAIDQAVIDHTDDTRLTRELAEGANLGFAGKVCIHPGQVAAVHAGLSPTPGKVARAQGIVAGRDAVALADEPPERERPPRPVTGRYFEQLSVGEVIHHAVTRTITEADNTFFSCVTMNPQPLHLDEDFAAASQFGTRIVNSMFTLAVVVGLSVYELTLGTVVANLGFTLAETPRPVFHGDTLRVETEVCSARPSRTRPSTGIVEFEHRGYNQHETLVARCRRHALMVRSAEL